MISTSRAVRLMLGLTIFAVACEGTTFRDLWNLSSAIGDHFHHPAKVSLNNGKELVITFENEKEGGLPLGERNQYARQVAQFAYAQYPRRGSLKTVVVDFAWDAGLPGLKVSADKGMHSWTVAELKAAADSLKKP